MNAIVAEDLRKTYKTGSWSGFLGKRREKVEALRGVSFSVDWGEVFGLLGPNGAGKTTTVKILTTLLLPDSGRAWVAGRDVIDEPLEVRKRIGAVLSVEKGFFWKLTGRENLRYFGMLRGLKGRDLEERISRVMRLVGLDRLGGENKLYEEYSLGMKARLALARAMLHDPPILILDEPTLGLDPQAAREIRELLVRLAREEGKAVMVTTHNMFEAELICDRVAIISRGRIAAIGRVEELKRIVADRIPIVIRFSGPPRKGFDRMLAERIGTELSVNPLDGGYEARILGEPGREESLVSEAVNALVSSGYKVLSIRVEEPTLEDVFIKVAGAGSSGGDD